MLLLHHAIHFCRLRGYKKMTVGTGNSSVGNLYFYQKAGFRLVSLVRDFFVLHYDEPIFEHGLQCRDLLILEMSL
jgi:GNAT superfamily N-acetyltransferase